MFNRYLTDPYRCIIAFYCLHIVCSYKDVRIKQYSKMTYLGCVLDGCLIGESMAMQVCTKVTSKLKFLYRKNRFLSKFLRRLLCDTLILSHFHCARAAWYPNFNKKYRKKLQVLQNKCIRFCLQLGKTFPKKLYKNYTKCIQKLY